MVGCDHLVEVQYWCVAAHRSHQAKNTPTVAYPLNFEHVLSDNNERWWGRQPLWFTLAIFVDSPSKRKGILKAWSITQSVFHSDAEPTSVTGVSSINMGDAIMAVWVSPRGSQTTHELCEQRKLNPRCISTTSTGIGGASPIRARNRSACRRGVAGDIGTLPGMTVVGDPVNIAQRLESMTKQLNTPLIVSKRSSICNMLAVKCRT